MKNVRTAGKIGRVPNQPRTPHRSIRIGDEDWADFDAAAKSAGADRGTVIKQFIRWYLRRPGAKLPERPERAAQHTHGTHHGGNDVELPGTTGK